MGFLFFWIGSSVTSLFMDVTNGLRLFKDVADAGYKIDIDKLNALQKELLPNQSKISLLSLLIPVYNFMLVIKNTMEYNRIRPYVFDALKTTDLIEEMSPEEKADYAKKPTLLNTVIVPIKMEVKLKKANKINFVDGDVTGEIYYEMGDKITDITIVKSTGNIAKLSEIDKKSYIVSAFVKVYDKGIKQFGNEENFRSALRGNEVSENSLTEPDTETQTQMTTREKIEALNRLKEDIMVGSQYYMFDTEKGIAPKTRKRTKEEEERNSAR